MWVHNAAGFLEGWMAEETIAGRLQACLERLYAGDAAAQAELWDLVNERLTVLARKMKRRDFSQVQRWAQTEDIAQNARVRLMRALQEAVPRTARDFYGLANLQIRRELLDTIRQMRGRNQDRDAPVSLLEGQDPENDTFDSHDLLVWQEFHEAIQELPAPEREAFELWWYQGLTHDEIAQVIGVDKSTVKRRCRSARGALAQVLPQDDCD
jgi:RNA polymerase sigma factor (sigma-70 family)